MYYWEMTMTALQAVHSQSRSSGSLRTGAEYLRSLNDGRQVFVDGEKVADVTRHPAFREAARSVARLYDIAAAPEMRERMTFVSPKTGAPVLRAYQIPRTHADLRARRLFSETWAEATFGLMGRSPDHVAGFFAGYAAVPSVFAAGGQKFADNVVAFYEKMRDEHLYLSYAIVPPQIDRSKPAHKQSDPTLHAGVVKERDDGIVIAGAQQVATGGVLSDWLIRRFGNRKWGRRFNGVVGLALAGLAFAASAWVEDVWLLGLLLCLAQFGNDFCMGPTWAACADIGERHAGTLSGVMNMTGNCTGAVGAGFVSLCARGPSEAPSKSVTQSDPFGSASGRLWTV